MDRKKIQMRFQDLLASRNLTPHAFALMYNLNVSTITAIAGGKQTPSIDTVCKICKCLGVGPEALLSEDDSLATLDEEERAFVEEYRNLDSKDKHQLKGYMDRLQDEKVENEHNK